MIVDEFIKQMENLKVLHRDSIEGCTTDEIAQLKKIQNIGKLPPLYVEFLSKLGKKAGAFGVGSDMFYPVLLELKEEAIYILDEEAGLIPNDAFVFYIHHGYIVWYFRTDVINSSIFEINVDSRSEGSHEIFKDFAQLLDYFVELYKRLQT